MSDKHKWIFDEIRRDLGWTVADWSVFKQGSPFKHLARENTQNTLDATKDTSKPVHIKFEVQRDVKFSNIIPNYQQFCEEFDQRVKQAIKDNDTQTKKNAEAALQYFNKCKALDKIDILKISDFNTTGLVGIKDTSVDSKFHKLVFGEGTSAREGESGGGTFGVGKFAPFTLTPLRTVLYFTKVENEGYGFSAKSSTSYRPTESTSEKPYTCRNMFVADIKDREYVGITDGELVDKFTMNRGENGTDIYIIGLRTDLMGDFVEKMTTEISERFFMAIYEEKLTCEIIDGSKREELNKENIENRLFHNYNYYSLNADGSFPKAFYQYQSRTKDKPIAEMFLRTYIKDDPNRVVRKKKITGFGEVELYLQFNPVNIVKDLIKSHNIMHMRRLLMRVEFEEYAKIDKSFIGILIIREDDDGNNLAADCENTTHNRWDTNNIESLENKALADKGFSEIKDWIRSILEEFKDETKEAIPFDDAAYWTWLSSGEGNPNESVELKHKYEHQESSEFNVSKKESKEKNPLVELIRDINGEIRLKEGDKPGKRRETKGTKYSTFTNNIKQSKVFHKDKNTYTVIVDVENAIEEIKGVIFARSGDSAKNLVEVELKLDSVKNVSSGEELKIVNDKKIIFENLTKGIHEFEFQTSKNNKLASTLFFITKEQQEVTSNG